MKRITVDLTKASTETLDLTDKLNPRVGDGQLSVPLHIIYGTDDSGNDDPVDMRDKDIEFLSQDTNKNDIYVSGTVTTNSKGDDPYNGNVTFVFPEGTFKVAGTYDVDKTMFRIINKADKIVLSTVNVKLNVLEGGNSDYNFDPNKTSYNSRLEDMLKLAQSQMKDKVANAGEEAQAVLTDAKQKAAGIIKDASDQSQALLDDIKQTNSEAKGNVAGDTAATAKQAKQQANDNAGNIHDLQAEVGDARGRFMTLSDRENKQDFNINRKEDKSNANYNYAALNLEDRRLEGRQTALSLQYQNGLARINVNPEFFADLKALSAKYPSGKEGVFILDNGHTAIYQNGWEDSGHSITIGEFTYHAFTSVDDVIAPYDSLDTLPANSVVFYAPDVVAKFFKLPSGSNHASIAVVTMGADFRTQNNCGRIQRFIDRYGGGEYYRTLWVGNDGIGDWGEWHTPDGMQQIVFPDEPLSAPYDDLNTLPYNKLVFYAPLKSLKNNPLNEAIVVKTEGPNIPTDKNYGGIQTVIGQQSGKKCYRTRWVGNDGIGDWGKWHTPDGMQQIVFPDEPLSAPYDDLNTLPYNKLVFYAPLKSLKNNPLNEAIVVKTEGPNIPTDKNYGGIQTVIGQQSGKKCYRTRWVGNDGIGDWGNWHGENIIQGVNKTGLNGISLSIFDKIAVIGDSYSAGWLLKPDGSSFYDKSKYQWSRLLGKKYGFAVNNLSMSGWTAQDFVNSKLNDITEAGPQDAYIIALGINDQSNGKETLGSKDDLKEDYQSNPDSFYGNMGKIIGTIKANDSDARIILLTIMRNDGAVTTTFDSAIKKIAEHYGLPVADITIDPYFQTDTYRQLMAGGHPTIIGYGALAEHLDAVLQKTILDNYDYFCNTTSIFDNTVK